MQFLGVQKWGSANFFSDTKERYTLPNFPGEKHPGGIPGR